MNVIPLLQRRVMPTLRVSTAMIGLAVPISTALDNVLLAVVLLGLFLNAPALAQIAVRNPVARAALLLFGMLSLAMFYGQTPMRDAVDILGKYIDLAFVPIFMLMFEASKTRAWAERAFIGAMGLTLFMSYLLGFHVIEKHEWMSVFAQTTNPVIFHSHITQNNMMAYVAFLALLKCRDALTTLPRAAWGVFAALAIANVLFMVQGRTGYIILLVLLGWFAWTSLARRFLVRGKSWGWKQGSTVLVSGLILVTATYLASPRLHDRVGLMEHEFQAWHPNLGNELSSTGQRLDFYYNTLQIIEHNWLYGVGTGGFTNAFAQQIQGTNALLTHNPHNEYLLITVQTGIVGLALLLYLFYTEWRVAPLLESSYTQDAARGLVLAYIVNCLFNSALHDHADGLFFAFMSALWFSTLRKRKYE
ncbi:MAG: O-antigen ligase family protein [Gallionella sp.]